MNNITSAMALETRRAGRSSSMKKEWDDDRNGSRLGQLEQPLPHRFQFVARQHGNERCRQCVHQRALAGFRIGGMPEPAQSQEAAASLIWLRVRTPSGGG